MDLRHLHAFVAIVDAGGFARAAARLHLSQPALSRQVHALESELDLRLFDRRGRRVQLTGDGEDLLSRARRLLADVQAFSERARALRGGETGVLRVGATPQAIETLLAPFLRAHRRRHPGVEVTLVEDGGARLPGRLERGEVQLAQIPAGDARFSTRLLFPLYVLAVQPAARRARRPAVIEITALADTPLVLLRRDFGSRAWFDAACEIAHVRPRVVLESGAPHTVVALARTGHGIAVVPSNALLPSRGLDVVPVVHRGVPIGRWAGIAWDPRRALAPYAERFVTELVAHARRDYPGAEVTRRAPPLPRRPGEA
ncbi:MAG TPA: LysR family transcriptional regulator [Methylomirabilota bacterium]|jgi:LysR family transcriptional regulator, cyn operon transcriptional activator|nr:LysR family transcriptional regulator [Methylomirabilota bacterium]